MSAEFQPIVLQPDDGSVSPPTAVELFPFGLTVNRVYVSDGKTNDVVIGPYDVQDYKNSRRFQNCIVGRYCNRIPVGKQTIEKDGITGTISPIATEGPTVSLHGGPVALDRVVFPATSEISSAKLFTPAEITSLKSFTSSSSLFSYTSPDGDQGFPGELLVEVIVALSNPSRTYDPKTFERQLGSTVIIYRAKVKSANPGEKVVTPVNLTQHWGFNLDASYATPGGDTPDVKQHKLYVNAEKILKGDEVLLPTGELVDVENTKFDFGKGDGELIGSRYEGGYDHFYLFPPSSTRQPSHVPLAGLEDGSQNLITSIFDADSKAQTVLSSERSGITLKYHTNQRGVQFYTGIGMDGSGGRKKIHGGTESGTGYKPASAAFLEFHAPHAAYLHAFKQGNEVPLLGDDTLLTSDEVYHHWVRVDMSHIAVRGE